MVSLSLMATLIAAAHTAAAYSPFVIKPLTTHQPIGNNEGETNFYSISFTVSSCNGAEGANSTATCQQSWGDNSWAQSADYSLYVPTGEWIACGQDSEFSFQLFPYFAIGNFTLAVQQNFTDIRLVPTPPCLSPLSTFIIYLISALLGYRGGEARPQQAERERRKHHVIWNSIDDHNNPKRADACFQTPPAPVPRPSQAELYKSQTLPRTIPATSTPQK